MSILPSSSGCLFVIIGMTLLYNLLIQMSSQLLGILKDGDFSNSGTLEHIVNLVRSTVQNKSDLNGLSNIEIFSYYLRNNKFEFKEFLQDTNLAQQVNKPKDYDPYVTQVHQLINKVNKNNDNRPYLKPQLLQEYAALKTAGISIGQTNAYYLNKVLKSLAIEHQTKSIRFWGKILGYKDYYIIQGVSSKVYLNDLPENAQRYGQGVNTYSYWASTDILGNWVELPLITPQQSSGSKTFKYIFTGQLEAAVAKSESFVGQQKHLLKCIVSRITHSCELAPKGLYKANEQNPTQIDFQEQYKLPQVSEMNSLDNWVHQNPNILLQGRCSYYIDPKIPEEQRETLNAELAQKDPIIQRLKGIAQDKPYEPLGYTSNWVVNISGQTVAVNQVGKQEGTTLIYGVATLRNLVWPGAATVGYRGGWVNIYVGYGHRISQQYLAIRQIKDVQTQAEQKGQRSQPNPSKAPVEKKEQVPVDPVQPSQ